MTRDQIAAIFAAGFKAGFDVTREGWNGECRFDHLAPSAFAGEDGAYEKALQANVAAYLLEADPAEPS